MASSTKTENYQLNQYGANDQPTWVGDYSGDMLKIDTALGNAAKRTGDKFNETETYAVGNLCIKDDLLYKFTAAKEAGAWDETKVKATTIEAEFEQLNGDITQLTENSKWKLFGSRTGSNRLGIKELVDAGREIKVVVEAQYSSVGERTKFVFYLLPSEDIKGIYSSGYCFSSTNYASVSISVSSDLSVLIMPSWWKMVENASNSVALNDTTATLKVYYR